MIKDKVNRNYLQHATGRIKRTGGRGNPGQHPMNRLRTVIWCEAIMVKLRLKDQGELGASVDPEKSKRFPCSPKINDNYAAYITGAHVPFDQKDGTIDQADLKAPGTARWFHSPLWSALKGEFEFPDDLLELIGAMPAIQSIVFSCSESLEYDIPAENGHPALKGEAPVVSFDFNRISDCVGLNGLDLLEAVVLLLEYGHLSRKSAISTRALELYRSASPKISEIPELQYCFETMFEAIEDRYANYIDLPPDEIFPPWHVRMPELTQRIYDIEKLSAAAQTTTVEENGTWIGADSIK